MIDATCLKLVNQSLASRDGSLVPEAAPFPRVSHDGRTYTFRVSADFTRFSNGERVTAYSFLRAFERAGNSWWRRHLTADIRSVSVQGSRLRIKLERRAGDLLTRLATPLFCAVPPTTPLRVSELRPLPAAGPYYVAEAARWKVRLRRNPHYRGLRQARAREIVYSLDFDYRRSLERLANRATDLVVATYSPESWASPTVRSLPRPVIRYLAFDNRAGKPFANRQLRRAAALALDRNLIVRAGGPGTTATTSILAATVRRSPTAGNGSLTRTPAALEEARRLAQPFLPVRIELAVHRHGSALRQGEAAAAQLRDVGFDVAVRPWPLAGCEGHHSWDLMFIDFEHHSRDPVEIFDRLLAGDERYVCQRAPSGPRLGSAWRRAVEGARQRTGPARAAAFAALDARITTDALVAPLTVLNEPVLVSARIGCFRRHPLYGFDLTAFCLRR
jgi:ABC-type transport system substrate-binding protein